MVSQFYKFFLLLVSGKERALRRASKHLSLEIPHLTAFMIWTRQSYIPKSFGKPWKTSKRHMTKVPTSTFYIDTCIFRWLMID
uniref:Uncharacterized protein n=1 Tax=Lactuca sativa TaxID=4236 RepID=A0A9R1XCA3_LACSA|nr:hypothetical protein LSAT_V11C500241870 [Lactuca sativa]